jgi:DNA-directed RNA polymerase subunit RPC12/RpoP
MANIRFDCSKCSQTIEAPEELASQSIECPHCNDTIQVPGRSQDKAPPKPIAIPPRVRAQNPLCHTCGEGALIKRKKFRMSGPVVAIGFILLIPSFLGMLCGVIMLVITGVSVHAVSSASDYEIRTNLVALQIPDSIVTNVVAGRTVSEDQLALLTAEQRTKVQDAQSSIAALKVGAGVGGFALGGFSVFIIIVSFVGGLLGWLLVMRKKVLQCARCGAIVPAS